MAQSDQVVTQITDMMNRYRDQVPMDFDALVNDYIAQVEAVNQRLDRCVRLLRAGRRSEAIHQAEIAPAVLHEAVQLDFPQRSKWERLCQQQGVDALPSINADAVAELDAAYPQEQAMAKLLNRHRLLALSRAPLPQRIEILRQLSQADPYNPAWGEDLLAFERARHQQLAPAAMAAAKAKDLDQLEKLLAECRKDWLEPPDVGIVQQVQQQYKQLQTTRVVQRIQKLHHLIAQTYAQQDEPRLGRLLADWEKCRQQAQSADPTPQPVTDAVAWFNDRRNERTLTEQHHKALAALEQALDEHADADKLETCWNQLWKLERPIPRVLQQRYENTMASRRVEAGRRHRLVSVSVWAGILLVAGIVGYLIHQNVSTRQIHHWESQFRLLIEQERFADADQLISQVREKPGLWADPRIAAVVLELQQEVESERVRSERFEAALARLQTGDLAAPDAGDLTTVTELARRPNELHRLESVQAEMRQLALAAQQRRDQAFDQSLAELRQQYTQLRQDERMTDVQRFDALRQVQNQLTHLLGTQDVSEALRSAAQALALSLTSWMQGLDEQIQSQRAMQQALAELQQDELNMNELGKRIDAFVTQFGHDPIAQELRQVRQTLVVHDAIEHWRQIVSTITPLRLTTQEQAQQRVETVTKYISDYPNSPHTAALQTYLSYLRHADVALQDEHQATDQDSDLQVLLVHPVLRLFQVPMTDQRRMFVLPGDWRHMNTDGSRVLVRYVINFDQAAERQRRAERWVELEQFPATPTPEPSAQYRFAQSVGQRLEADFTWETIYFELLQLLLDVPDMDPLLRVTLASRLASLASEYGWPRQLELQLWAASLAELHTGTTWLDPFNAPSPDSSAVREAVRYLQRRPNLDAMIAAVEQWLAELDQPLRPRHTAGLLGRNVVSEPTWLQQPGVLEDGLLQVLEGGAFDQPWRFLTVGHVRQGQTQWLPIAAEKPIGTVIYHVQ